ncbi:MAG TPA: hypothetical protein VEC43_01765 [Candidatus Acidoferrales bacterium]|nr:hypothetical protein [Candidatus Acidoferrales bacterium]
MSDSKGNSLDDVISNLDRHRDDDQWEIRSSTPDDLDRTKEHEKPVDDAIMIALEQYLASRLQQVGEVPPEKKEIKGLKTGNGWDANQVVEQVFKIEPISIKRAIEVAVSSNRTLRERLSFRNRKEDFGLVGTPTVEFVPIWKVKGFHECYYIRGSSYKVQLKDDVVAVEMEGRSRDLMLERKHRRLIPAAIMDRLQKIGSFLPNESKYFVLTDALELAVKSFEAELVISGLGRPLTIDDEAELTSWKSKRIFDEGDMKVRGARVQIREPALSKEALLTKFRERVIHMPENFKQILSNKLQITELKRIYVPLIRIPLQKGLVPREAVVNGTTGELADPSLLALFE